MNYKYYLGIWNTHLKYPRVIYRLHTDSVHDRLVEWNPTFKTWVLSAFTLSDLQRNNQTISIEEIPYDRINIELTMMELIE